MTKTDEEIKQERYCKEIQEYVFESGIFDEDDKEAEYEAGVILYYISTYNPKCLIETLIDVDNLWIQFSESYEPKERDTRKEIDDYCQGLEDHIFNTWKAKGSVRDEEETRGSIRDFTLLLCNYGCLGVISIVINVIDMQEAFDSEYFQDQKDSNVVDKQDESGMYN